MTAEEFKKIRRRAGKSQHELALFLQVSQGQISIWENGYRPIPADVADRMDAL